MPGFADQRKQREGNRSQDERAAEHDPRPEAIRQRTCDEAREKRGCRAGGDDQPSNTERDPADVVQVDDQEGPDHPVSEHVGQPARLQDPNVPRQLRIEAA